jgi:hypothetical protein
MCKKRICLPCLSTGMSLSPWLEKLPVGSDTSSHQIEYTSGGPRPPPDVLKERIGNLASSESWLLVRPFGRVEWRAKRFPEPSCITAINRMMKEPERRYASIAPTLAGRASPPQ